jgi:hypothetical protein
MTHVVVVSTSCMYIYRAVVGLLALQLVLLRISCLIRAFSSSASLPCASFPFILQVGIGCPFLKALLSHHLNTHPACPWTRSYTQFAWDQLLPNVQWNRYWELPPKKHNNTKLCYTRYQNAQSEVEHIEWQRGLQLDGLLYAGGSERDYWQQQEVLWWPDELQHLTEYKKQHDYFWNKYIHILCSRICY